MASVSHAYAVGGHKVKVFSSSHGRTVHEKYVKLFAQAVKFKSHNHSEEVLVHLCIYKLDNLLVYNAMANAVNHGVKVHLLYHKSEVAPLEELVDQLEGVAASEEKKKKKKEEIVHITADGAANLRVTRMKWADNSNDQMHNKFMLVSRTCSSSHVVLVATANMDAKKHKLDWHQTAIAVYNHDGLYHAYLQYMEVIAAHKEAIAPFRKHMHKNPIDYKDEHFQAYFYPTHDIRDTSRNVLFHLIDQVEAGESQNARLSVNMAFFKKDVFGEALVSKLTAAKEKAASCGKNFTIVSSIMEEGELGPFPDFDGKLAQACTHSKDYTFAFLDLQEFYSITGSTNCKENDYAKKANTMLVVREVGESHPVYDVFEAIHRSIPAGGNSEGH